MKVYTVTHRIEEVIDSSEDTIRLSDAKLNVNQAVLDAINETLIFLSIEGIKKYIKGQCLTLNDSDLEYLKHIEEEMYKLIIIYPFKRCENYTEYKRYIIMLKEAHD